jgi:hypothetical protein
VNLINWPRLEDLLVRACELEVQCFARDYPSEPVFACCLEFDGLTGGVELSYGTQGAVGQAVQALKSGGEGLPYYRNVELRPQHWARVRMPAHDPAGVWQQARPILGAYAEAMEEGGDTEAAEFLWLRYEYLMECVVRRLIERDAFRPLAREPHFIAYAANEEETLEELEDRLEKLYPRYRRAAAELVALPRTGHPAPEGCSGRVCGGKKRRAELARCTACQRWLCPSCGNGHVHRELLERRPFFG